MLPTKIVTDDTMVEVNDDGFTVPREDAVIYSDRIVCHPTLEVKLKKALNNFQDVLGEQADV